MKFFNNPGQDLRLPCGINEEFNTCGPACPKTCDTLSVTQFCTLQCVKGCFCLPGYVRNALGICIAEQLCPSSVKCPSLLETYNPCGTSCQPTCANYQTLPFTLCIKSCNPGCFYINGLVRDENTGRCVPPKACSYLNSI